MADHLCEEIIPNILHKLPVKTLLRCTSICKSWYSLITSPQFIFSHLHFAASTKNRTPLLLVRRTITESEHYDLFSDNDSFTLHSNIEFPFRSINAFFTIVGSCNGLICLSDDRVYHTHTIILWNPCIKKSVLLPKPNSIYSSYGTFSQSLGFGFDPVASDYKVIRITYADCVRVEQPLVQLYKLSTGVWQDLSFLSLECVIHSKSRQAYVNGAAHWVARHMDSHTGVWQDLIVFFDMCGEVFGELMLPFSLVNSHDLVTGKELVVYNKSLALILWNVLGPQPSFCVWVMKEYGVQESWTKHLSIDVHDFGDIFMRPLWVMKHGEVITVGQDGYLISYDPNGEAQGEGFKDLGVDGLRSEDYRRSVHVDSYVESLVLLEKGHYSCDALTCKKLPTLHASDCGSVGGCGSDYAQKF
ncbi:hypothetical protein OROHE_012954 [Orobanche hederae]